MGLNREWGQRRKAVECSLGEIFRNRLIITALEWAGTEFSRNQEWQLTP